MKFAHVIQSLSIGIIRVSGEQICRRCKQLRIFLVSVDYFYSTYYIVDSYLSYDRNSTRK